MSNADDLHEFLNHKPKQWLYMAVTTEPFVVDDFMRDDRYCLEVYDAPTFSTYHPLIVVARVRTSVKNKTMFGVYQ